MDRHDDDLDDLYELPAGWSPGCRTEDLAWCDTYRSLDSPADIANPVDALPPGYSAHTMITTSRESRQADGGLGDAEIKALLANLRLDDVGLYSCGFFFNAHNTCTATGLALTATFLGDDYSPWPTVWFPHDRSFFVSSPYDEAMTYIASNADLARRLRNDPELNATSCTYDPLAYEDLDTIKARPPSDLNAIVAQTHASTGSLDEAARAGLARTNHFIAIIKALMAAQPGTTLPDAKSILDRNLPSSRNVE